MRLLRTLDAEHVKLRSKKYAAESKQDVYSRVLRRHTDINNVGQPDFIKKEWSGAINSLQNAHVHFFLSNMFRRWIDWVSRRVSRRQCMRRVRHLTAANQECLLSRYFRCWQGHRMKKKNLRGVLQLRLLEERVSFVGIGSPSAAVSQSLACKAGTALAEAQRRSLLQRYYKPWFYRVTRLRRNLTCSVAFNRLLLSYDTRLADTTFMFHSLTATNSRSQRHSRALWLLEQRMAVSHRQLQRCFFRKWLSFLRDQRDSNQTFHLVESLTSVLVDEVMLRARVYFRWYRFAMFEVKLRRFDEERATLQREWIVVQNAVESKETLPELQLEEEQLEVEIAQLAFERDEIESQNTLLRADIVHLQMNKSIERVLVGYTDPEDNAKVATRRTSSVPHNRRLHSASREYFSSPREDDSYAEAALLWQLSAVLRALKGTVLRCKRHSNIITSAYERVVRLPICEKAAESRDWSSSISYSSLGGDSSAVHGISGASLADTRNSSERRRSLVSLTHTTYLAEEFDRVVMRLQVLVTEAAKQASVDLDESINQAIAPFLKQAMEVANTECLPLQWLNFVPHTVRMEILPLLVELIVMYDSFKAHSDAEVEGVGKTISTRGTVKVVPLPLRSLCRMQTATWLVRHCVVVLEFMAPGTRDSHINMWILADSVKELVAVEKQGFTPGPPLGKSAKNNESTSDWKEMASFMSDTSVQTTKSSTREKRKQRSGCILNQSQSALGTQHGTAQSTPRTVAEGVQSFHSTPRKATPTLPHRKYMSTYSNPQSPKKPRILERITREQPAQPQRRCVATLSNLQSPKKHKIFEGSSTTDQVHPAPQRSNSVPLRQPNLIPAARSMISTPLTRPYLGFRVSVGYDENKRTTLSIQEVAHSYISSTCETEQIGPAYQAGLRVGDQLVRFAGYTVTDLAAFNTVVARHVRPSISIPVVFSRNGIVMSATIVVGEKNRE
uniref:PDZ domain-containing protein n=1 Tax=Trypanosoma congolense (strain IL3000) TaxID=1068625 RepID=G0UYP1_TRYCI|nr:conserved hypothetical protein [Trypanosoma congolense IL3000]